jgi:hypothetical protein
LGTVTSAPNLVMRGARWSACSRGSREARPQVVGEVLLVGTPMNDLPPARLGEVVGIGRDDGASVSAVAGNRAWYPHAGPLLDASSSGVGGGPTNVAVAGLQQARGDEMVMTDLHPGI